MSSINEFTEISSEILSFMEIAERNILLFTDYRIDFNRYNDLFTRKLSQNVSVIIYSKYADDDRRKPEVEKLINLGLQLGRTYREYSRNLFVIDNNAFNGDKAIINSDRAISEKEINDSYQKSLIVCAQLIHDHKQAHINYLREVFKKVCRRKGCEELSYYHVQTDGLTNVNLISQCDAGHRIHFRKFRYDEFWLLRDLNRIDTELEQVLFANDFTDTEVLLYKSCAELKKDSVWIRFLSAVRLPVCEDIEVMTLSRNFKSTEYETMREYDFILDFNDHFPKKEEPDRTKIFKVS